MAEGSRIYAERCRSKWLYFNFNPKLDQFMQDDLHPIEPKQAKNKQKKSPTQTGESGSVNQGASTNLLF